MEDKKVIVIEGENHTIKSLSEMADKENVKVVIVGEANDVVKHRNMIEKFAITGYILICANQLTVTDRERLKETPKHHPLEAPKTEDSLIERITRSIELCPLPEPMIYEHKQEFRKVKHTQAKPIKQFSRPVKNHHFKRK